MMMILYIISKLTVAGVYKRNGNKVKRDRFFGLIDFFFTAKTEALKERTAFPQKNPPIAPSK